MLGFPSSGCYLHSLAWVLSVAKIGDALLGSRDQEETSLRHHISFFCMALTGRLGMIRRKDLVFHAHTEFQPTVVGKACHRAPGSWQQSVRWRLFRPLWLRSQRDWCTLQRSSDLPLARSHLLKVQQPPQTGPTGKQVFKPQT